MCMTLQRQRLFWIGLSGWVLVVGCNGNDRNWKETVPVTGVITVNGQPAEGVHVTFHPAGGMDQAQPTETKAITDKEGKFAASTYVLGDGAPPGEYTLTFSWPKLNTISMAFEGDKLKGKYDQPGKSQHKIVVESGQPLDLGTIDLKP
ncbi:MAG: carboxypeptidase regulatory-like domain-containing protein [Planctomycetota bacterium]|nr:MAG: carboxypeptidase regulatory-like domain-containing protein [Planctomycetota bacterium]